MPEIHPSAHVDDGAVLGDGVRVWHLAQVRDGARVGPGTIVGRGVYIDTDVEVGANCKIQNHAMLYGPATIADGVFIGPMVVFTNDRHPRATDLDLRLKTGADWAAEGVHVDTGASVGASSTVLPGVRIGRWALIGAGSLVTSDVPAHALVHGRPARQHAWVGRAGVRLEPMEDGDLRCPVSDERYRVGVDDRLEGPS